MLLKLRDIRPNPFRDFKVNPLLDEKVESLKASIRLTGFWDNVVVRFNAEKQPELAYGHHRLKAALKCGVTEANFIVKELDDAMMIQIMDNENLETYGSTPLSLIESVRAVVQSLAKGVIAQNYKTAEGSHPFVLDSKVNTSQLRYAPSFIPGKVDAGGSSPGIPYTALSVALFLGRTESSGEKKGRKEEIRRKPEDAIVAALNYLHAKEKSWVTDDILVTKDSGGGHRSITVNELLKRTREIREIKEAKEKSEKGVIEAERKALEEKRRLETEAKERAKEIETKRQAAVEKEAQARVEKDKLEIARQKQKQEDLAKQAEEKAVIDKIKIAAIDAKVAETKRKAEAAQKESERAPIVREQAALLVLIEAPESFQERVRAHFRKNLTAEEREIMRQALMARGERSFDLSRAGLPPLTAKQWAQLYAEREQSKRKKEAAEQSKKETKKRK